MPLTRIRNSGNINRSGIVNSNITKIQDSIDNNVNNKNIYDDTISNILSEKILKIAPVLNNNNIVDYYIAQNSGDAISIDNINDQHILASQTNIINTPCTIGSNELIKIDTKNINIINKQQNNDAFFENSDLISFFSENIDFNNQTIDEEISQYYDIKNQKIIKLELDFSNSSDLYLLNTQHFYNNGTSFIDDYDNFNEDIKISQRVNLINNYNSFNDELITISSHLLTSSFYNFNDNCWEYNTISKKIGNNYYNFNISSNEFIDSGLNFPDLIKQQNNYNDNSDIFKFTQNYLLHNAIATTHSFNNNDDRFNSDTSLKYNLITNTFGFPNSQVWKTTKNHTKNLSNYIDSDFLLEKVIIKGKYSANIEQPNYWGSFYNENINIVQPDVKNQFIDENNKISSNITFLLIKEKENILNLYHNNLSGYFSFLDNSKNIDYINFNTSVKDLFIYNDINELQYNENYKVDYFKLNKIINNNDILEDDKHLYIIKNNSNDSLLVKYNKNYLLYDYENDSNSKIYKFNNLTNQKYTNKEKEIITSLTLDISNDDGKSYINKEKNDFFIYDKTKIIKTDNYIDENSFNVKSKFYKHEEKSAFIDAQNIITYNITNLKNYFDAINGFYTIKTINNIEFILGVPKQDLSYYNNNSSYDIMFGNSEFPIKLKFYYDENIGIQDKTISDFFIYSSDFNGFYIININLFLLQFYNLYTNDSTVDYLLSDKFLFHMKKSINEILTTQLYFADQQNIININHTSACSAIIKLIELSILLCVDKNKNNENYNQFSCIISVFETYNNNFNSLTQVYDYFNYRSSKNINNIDQYGNNFVIFNSKINEIQITKFKNNIITSLFNNSYNYKQYIDATYDDKYYYNKINILTGKNKDDNIIKNNFNLNIKQNTDVYDDIILDNFETINNIETKNTNSTIILKKEDNLLLNVSSFTGFNNLISNVCLHDKLSIYLIGRDLSKKQENKSTQTKIKRFYNDYLENNNFIRKINIKQHTSIEKNEFIYDTIVPKLDDLYTINEKSETDIVDVIDLYNNNITKQNPSYKYVVSDDISHENVLNFKNKKLLFNELNKANINKKFISNFNIEKSKHGRISDFYLYYDINSINYGNDKFKNAWLNSDSENLAPFSNLSITLKQQFNNTNIMYNNVNYQNTGIKILPENEENIENKFLNNLNQFNFKNDIIFTINLENNKFISLQYLYTPLFLNDSIFDYNKINNYFDIFSNLHENTTEPRILKNYNKTWCLIFDINEYIIDSNKYFSSLISLIKDENKNIKIFNYKEDSISYFSDLFIIYTENGKRSFYINKYENIYYFILPLKDNKSANDFEELLNDNGNKNTYINDIINSNFSIDIIDFNDFNGFNELLKPNINIDNFDENVNENLIKYFNFNFFYENKQKQYDLYQLTDIYLKNSLFNSFYLNDINEFTLKLNNINNKINKKYLINKHLFSNLENIQILDEILYNNKNFYINNKIYFSDIYIKQNNKFIKTNNKIIYEIDNTINNEKFINILGLDHNNNLLNINKFDDSYIYEYNFDLFKTDFYVFENFDEKDKKYKLNKESPYFVFNFKSILNNDDEIIEFNNTINCNNKKISIIDNELKSFGTPIIKITNENENIINEFLFSYRKNKKYKKPIDKKDGILYCLENTNKQSYSIKNTSKNFGMISDNINGYENKVLIKTNNSISNITVIKKYINEYFMYLENADKEKSIHQGSNTDIYSRSYYPYIEGDSGFIASLL